MKLNQRLANRLFATVAWSAAVLLSANLFAQTQAGRAEVKAVRGAATYSVAGGPPIALKVGTALTSGATVKTGPEASVDLFLGNSAGTVRLTENSTLNLDKLNLTDTGAETVVDIQLYLPEGTILFNVNKLSPASKYEIKVPNGVAGIRGTKGRGSSTGYWVLLEGTLIFVHVPPATKEPQAYTLVAPPAKYFSPLEGVKDAPDDLVTEVLRQMGKGMLREGPEPDRQVDPTFEYLDPLLEKDETKDDTTPTGG